jgi:hypothetical protein
MCVGDYLPTQFNTSGRKTPKPDHNIKSSTTASLLPFTGIGDGEYVKK